MSDRAGERRPRSGWYCTECGALYTNPGSGVITCQRCGHLGLRGFDRGPIPITCTHEGCDWTGWEDGVNNDRGRHLRRDHPDA